MNRKDFITACSKCSLGVLIAPALLEACASTKYIHALIVDSDLVVSLSDFEIIKNETVQYHKYIVVQHDSLQFPICVYRISPEIYHALWMQCTHQGTELHVFGDRLQCPAHGSEFKING
ncbi:MAG TPA: Rieske 2Fe-2S domain-containing protein, partial [Cyclobacteriaceae bacterium]